MEFHIINEDFRGPDVHKIDVRDVEEVEEVAQLLLRGIILVLVLVASLVSWKLGVNLYRLWDYVFEYLAIRTKRNKHFFTETNDRARDIGLRK
jgi:hypothetical protein